MNEIQIRRKNRQIGVALCILEGKSTREVSEEYSISRYTVKRDLEELYLNGYGKNAEENKRNRILAYKALKVIEARTTKKIN